MFAVIETGEQATMDNAGLIYDRVRTQLGDLSLSLAPPRLQNRAERVDQVSAELSSLSGERRDLEDAPTWWRVHRERPFSVGLERPP